MNPALLLAQFDRISEAPDAVPRLRRFILDLAVRGKLVEQDPQDEPASQLFQRIQAEKARLVKTAQIRKQKPFSPIESDEVPFVAPHGWIWTRIRQVTSDRGQKIPDQKFTYIDVTAIDKEAGCVADAKVLSPANAPSRARKLVHTGDVLYSCVRPYLLNIAVIDIEMTPAPIASTAFAVLNGFGLVLPMYLWITLRSPFMVQCVEPKMRGQAYPAINDADFANLPFPLPPLAEQQRIAAKVDELMTLCDQLKAAREGRESQRDLLAKASLHHLNNGVNVDAFREHVRFYLRHLPQLTISPTQIPDLRQSILNLAVRGKLVPQNLNEESASHLLDCIRAQKEELIQRHAIKRESGTLSLSEEECRFDLPTSWRWVPLQSIIVFGPQNGISPKPSSRSDAPKAITLTATTKGVFDSHYFKQVEAKVPQDSEFWLRSGDLLFQRGNTREYVGIAAYYTGEPCMFLYPDLMMKVRLSEKVSLRYIHLCAVAPHARAYFSTNASGAQATMPKINQGILLRLPIPLPPFSEQLRIVTKVDELMAICDHLEAQLTAVHVEARLLLESVLFNALNETSSARPSPSRSGKPNIPGVFEQASLILKEQS